MQPGWYPDPYTTGLLRWWDGQAWTGHTTAQSYYGMAAPNPAVDLADALSSGKRASIALIFGAALIALGFVLDAVVVGPALHDIVDQIRADVRLLDADPNAYIPPLRIPGKTWLGSVISLPLIAVQVLFIIWLHHAAKLARNVGLPAARSQVWVVLGWLIPVVSLWFPYQVVRDVFPPGDPARRVVGQWWGLYLAQNVVAIPLIVVAIFSTTAAALLAVPAIVLTVLAARAARIVIGLADTSHRRLLGVT